MLSRLAKDLVRATQEELTGLLEDFEVQQTLDIGAALIHTGRHDSMGLLMLVSDLTGGGAYLPL